MSRWQKIRRDRTLEREQLTRYFRLHPIEDALLTDKEINRVLDRLNYECPTCGKQFVPTRTASQLYCSIPCRISSKPPWWKILNRDNFQCQYCGKNPTEDDIKLHIDHIIPKCDGGTDDSSNLVTACSKCNLDKSGTPLRHQAEFKKRIGLI